MKNPELHPLFVIPALLRIQLLLPAQAGFLILLAFKYARHGEWLDALESFKIARHGEWLDALESLIF